VKSIFKVVTLPQVGRGQKQPSLERKARLEELSFCHRLIAETLEREVVKS